MGKHACMQVITIKRQLSKHEKNVYNFLNSDIIQLYTTHLSRKFSLISVSPAENRRQVKLRPKYKRIEIRKKPTSLGLEITLVFNNPSTYDRSNQCFC